MIRPVRLQLSRRKGFNLQALSLATNGLPAVKVTRPGEFGNPFVIGEPARIGDDRPVRNAAEAVALFRAELTLSLEKNDFALDNLLTLRGKNLACWCEIHKNGVAVPCHADVLLELANTLICEAVPGQPMRQLDGTPIFARGFGGIEI